MPKHPLQRKRCRVGTDRETLLELEHEARWGAENAQTNAALVHLTDAEAALYSDLVTDRYGVALRLEQERIDWAYAARRVDGS